MTRIQIRLPSAALMRPVEIVCALPCGFGTCSSPYRAVWMLHGALMDGNIFFERLDGIGAAKSARVAILAPTLNNGFFINSDYERQADCLNEVFDAIGQLLPLSQEREDNAVLGISMGGFGSIRWALESGLFSRAASISGIFDTNVAPDGRICKDRLQKTLYQTFSPLMRKLTTDSNGNTRAECDFNQLLATATFLPQIDLYCGDKDFISLPQNLALLNLLKKYGCPAELHLEKGAHDEAFWKNIFAAALSSILV